MFMTVELAIYIIIFKAIFGATIGAVESAFFYRGLLKWPGMLRGISLGIFGFLTGSFLAGWASQHEAFYNGKRVDVAPWGENLWLRNRVVEYKFLLSFLLATIAVLLGHKVFGQGRSIHSPDHKS
jgi:hypothetical protein